MGAPPQGQVVEGCGGLRGKRQQQCARRGGKLCCHLCRAARGTQMLRVINGAGAGHWRRRRRRHDGRMRHGRRKHVEQRHTPGCKGAAAAASDADSTAGARHRVARHAQGRQTGPLALRARRRRALAAMRATAPAPPNRATVVHAAIVRSCSVRVARSATAAAAAAADAAAVSVDGKKHAPCPSAAAAQPGGVRPAVSSPPHYAPPAAATAAAAVPATAPGAGRGCRRLRVQGASAPLAFPIGGVLVVTEVGGRVAVVAIVVVVVVVVVRLLVPPPACAPTSVASCCAAGRDALGGRAAAASAAAAVVRVTAAAAGALAAVAPAAVAGFAAVAAAAASWALSLTAARRLPRRLGRTSGGG